MQRQIYYPTQLLADVNLLSPQREAMVDFGVLIQSILGVNTLISGFNCTPTGSPSLVVDVGPGFVFEMEEIDSSIYGNPGLPADTGNDIMKFAYQLSSTVNPFTFVAPGVGGDSRNDLIQIQLLPSVDGNSTLIPEWAGTSPVTVLTPTGTININVPNTPTSASVNLTRTDTVNITVKAGTAAPTGTQLTPTPDSGFVGAWVITTTNGVSTINTGQINRYSDPSLTGDDDTSFILETLTQKLSASSADGRYALKSQVQYAGGVVNGGMVIAQRQPFSITASTLGIGLVDCMMGQVTASTVTAGTLTQGTAQSYSYTGYTTQFAGVTTTGATTITRIYRMESNVAVNYINQTASFNCVVNHDVGASVNYQITISKANAKNNFGAITTIATGSVIPVASATPTSVSISNVAMASCGNGIQITLIAITAGGITTKNFHDCNNFLNIGANVNPFVPEDETVTRMRCMRRYQKSYDDGVAVGTGSTPGAIGITSTPAGGSNSVIDSGVQYKVPLISSTTPTLTLKIYDPDTGTLNALDDGTVGVTPASGTKSGNFFSAIQVINTDLGFHYEVLNDL